LFRPLLVTRSGEGARCATGVKVMRGWRNSSNPRRYRGRQCRRGDVTYRIWTRY
jgi:hypothetical protein